MCLEMKCDIWKRTRLVYLLVQFHSHILLTSSLTKEDNSLQKGNTTLEIKEYPEISFCYVIENMEKL